MTPNPLATNLYTVRDECERDFPGTLKRVAEIGYKAVETSETYGLSNEGLRKALDAVGLAMCGVHASIVELEADLDGLIDRCTALDCLYLTCVWIPTERRTSAEAWRAEARKLSEIGARCKQRGVQLCYHNHDFEFERFDGVYGLDLLYEHSDPEHLKVQLDVYWVQFGGADPLAYINKYAGRTPLLHIKDMADDAKRSFTEAGSGILDFPAILDAARAAGVQWYIAEQDTCTIPTLQSAAESYRYLKSIGY